MSGRDHPDARTLAAQLRIQDDHSFHVEGRHQHFHPSRNRFIHVPEGFPGIVGQVGQVVYDRYYMRPTAGRGPYRMLEDRNLRHEFARQLGEANAVRAAWSHGWTVSDRVANVVVVKQDQRVRSVHESDFEYTDRENGVGRIRTSANSSSMQPGWFHVFGATNHRVTPEDTVRVYWAVCRQGAVPLVKTLTTAFNTAGIEFHFKVDANPDAFRRSDAAVLYVPADRWAEMAQPLREVYAAVWPYLRDTTPMFTKRIAPGVGVGEEPVGGGSFGSSRAAYAAQGLWNARDLDADDVDGRAAAIADALRANGVDPDQPYRNPGSARDYSLDWSPTLSTLSTEVLQ